MEYLSFGPLLHRTRMQFLPEAAAARHALVLGDGDGRFCAALLRFSSAVRVHAVDASAGMLAELWRRAVDVGAADRLEMTCADATQCLPVGEFDLVCTHFFLDCLSTEQVAGLVPRIRERMSSGHWVVSEFAIPGGALRQPASWLVAGLYAAFHRLTGLEVRKLPLYPEILKANGFVLLELHSRLGGMLRAELWHRTE